MIKNIKSEFLRRQSDEIQELNSPLKFNKPIIIPDALNDDEAATLGNLKNIQSEILEQISNLTPEQELLNKITFKWNTIGSYGERGYSGIGCWTFLDSNGYPYAPVAIDFNLNGKRTPADTWLEVCGGTKTIYLVKTDENNINNYNFGINNANVRILTNPHTAEDEEFLANLNNCIKLNLRVMGYPVKSNYNEWGSPFYLFKLIQEKGFNGAGQWVTGHLITAYYCIDVEIIIEDENSIHEYLTNVCGLNFHMLASSYNSIYASRSGRLSITLNDKYNYLDENINKLTISGNVNPLATAAKKLVSVNLTKNEENNDIKLNSSITKLYIKPNEALFSKITYNSSLDKFVTTDL